MTHEFGTTQCKLLKCLNFSVLMIFIMKTCMIRKRSGQWVNKDENDLQILPVVEIMSSGSLRDWLIDTGNYIESGEKDKNQCEK